MLKDVGMNVQWTDTDGTAVKSLKRVWSGLRRLLTCVVPNGPMLFVLYTPSAQHEFAANWTQ